MTQQEYAEIGDDDFVARVSSAIFKGYVQIGHSRFGLVVSQDALKRLARAGYVGAVTGKTLGENYVYFQKDRVPEGDNFLAAFPIRADCLLMNGNIELESLPE